MYSLSYVSEDLKELQRVLFTIIELAYDDTRFLDLRVGPFDDEALLAEGVWILSNTIELLETIDKTLSKRFIEQDLTVAKAVTKIDGELLEDFYIDKETEDIEETSCLQCKHLGLYKYDSYRCKAFPNGIPYEIISGFMLHNVRIPEQNNNVIYETL